MMSATAEALLNLQTSLQIERDRMQRDWDRLENRLQMAQLRSDRVRQEMARKYR